MIRVLVPRPVADALLPRVCQACGGKGFSTWTWDDDRGIRHVDSFPCSACGGSTGRSEADWVWGSGSLPPVLTWLVVEGKRVSRRFGIPLPTDSTEGVLVPSADLVRAIESGERIGLTVECEACGCDQYSASTCGVLDCFAGRVLVGSVRPTEVLPVISPCKEGTRIRHICHQSTYGLLYHTPLDDPDPDGETERDLTEVLSLYGDPGSLVGRYAIAVTDARREG